MLCFVRHQLASMGRGRVGAGRGEFEQELGKVEIGDGIDDFVGAVGIAGQGGQGGTAAEDENGFVTELGTAEDIGFHSVADHNGFIGGQP